MKRKPHEIDIGIRVTGWSRYLVLRDIFMQQFSPKDGMRNAKDPYISLGVGTGGNDVWDVLVIYEAARPPSRENEDRFRVFLRGSLATIYHYNPVAVATVKE